MKEAKAEVLRYLGYRQQGLSPELDALIDSCLTECRSHARPKWVWRSFDPVITESGIQLAGTPLLLGGKDIRRHMGGCGKIAVMAAALGVEVDSLIRRWEGRDMTRAVILDACATQLIEEVCDRAQAELAAGAEQDGLAPGSRYSPGYGDLPLELQPLILEVLAAGKRIGLTCTPHLILLPRKSVTAFAGLFPKGGASRQPGGCDSCPMRDTCEFKRDGATNGCKKMVE